MKKKLLYFSPIPPHKSGIAAYSEALLAALSQHFEITVAVEPMRIVNAELYEVDEKGLSSKFRPDLAREYEVKFVGWDEIDYAAYPHKIYNVGNHPGFHAYMYDVLRRHPGLIILHDFVLYYLTVGRYSRRLPEFLWKMLRIGGLNAVLLQLSLLAERKHPLHCPSQRLLPLNREIIDSRNKIMVHSNYQRKRILEAFPQKADQVKVINHLALTCSGPGIGRDSARRRHGIDPDTVLISSFGCIADTKQNHLVCEIVNELSREYREIRYLMVGEGDYADHYLDDMVISKTGYVAEDEFMGLIRASDIVVNLRYPSMGETSGSVIRALAEGKPCIVTDDAWFSELPDSAVVKIPKTKPENRLKEVLTDLLENPSRRRLLGEAGRKLIETEFDPARIAQRIHDFLV